MLTPEERARIARENGAKSKGPITEEGKAKVSRNAITHGQRAEALKLIVPPHSACLANEDRQAFYKLFDILTAKYRPSDEAELLLVREMAENHWQITRNKQMESAIYNRELLRQGPKINPTLPELRELEIALAAQEALTGNKTIAELRRHTQVCSRTLSRLQRRYIEMRKHFEPAPEQTQPEATQPEENTAPEAKTYHINGPVTPAVERLYESVFGTRKLELVPHELPSDTEEPPLAA